jgi:hypothetical protein
MHGQGGAPEPRRMPITAGGVAVSGDGITRCEINFTVLMNNFQILYLKRF